MSAASPVFLVPERPNQELEQILTGLLDLARKGQLTGIVFGVSMRGEKYYCDAAGALHRSPVKALGVADMLADELRRKVRHVSQDTVF